MDDRLDAETVKQMHTNAGLDPKGSELLVVQPSKLKLQNYVEATATPFASLLRVKLNAYFVAPKPASCF